MADPVVWFEVTGRDPEGAAKFYGELFGWHAQPIPDMDYLPVDTHAGRGINGGFGKSQEGQPPSVTFYAVVPDPQAALDKAESLGATTVMPVTEVPDIVTFAIFSDPQGAMVGILKGQVDQDEGAGPSPGDGAAVGWFEILVREPEKAWEFYGALFGWNVHRSEGGDMVYGEIHDEGGHGISGGIGATPDGQPHVNLYADVDDVQKFLEKAEALGASTLMPPMDVGEGTTIAMFGDPQGTWFGLYRRSES